jgi:hypothetical protein
MSHPLRGFVLFNGIPAASRALEQAPVIFLCWLLRNANHLANNQSIG